MGPRKNAIARRAIERKRLVFENTHRSDVFGKRQDQYNREILVGILGRFGIRCNRKDLKPELMRKLREYEASLAEQNDDVAEAAEAFVRDFVPGATSPKIQCVVCMEYRRSYDFPQHKISNECQHPTEVCNTCLETHIAYFVDEYVAWVEGGCMEEMRTLGCPICHEELTAVHIREFGLPDVSERFDAAAAELASRNHPNYRLCCQPNCDAGQVHFGRERQMVCHTCNGSSCVFHGVPWHEGMSCNEYEITVNGNERSKKRRAQDEAKSERWVLNNTRLCTNLQCKAPIQKWQGCDQMHCRCGHNFSWAHAQRKRDISSER